MVRRSLRQARKGLGLGPLSEYVRVVTEPFGCSLPMGTRPCIVSICKLHCCYQLPGFGSLSAALGAEAVLAWHDFQQESFNLCTVGCGLQHNACAIGSLGGCTGQLGSMYKDRKQQKGWE